MLLAASIRLCRHKRDAKRHNYLSDPVPIPIFSLPATDLKCQKGRLLTSSCREATLVSPYWLLIQWYTGLLSEIGRELGLRAQFLACWKEQAVVLGFVAGFVMLCQSYRLQMPALFCRDSGVQASAGVRHLPGNPRRYPTVMLLANFFCISRGSAFGTLCEETIRLNSARCWIHQQYQSLSDTVSRHKRTAPEK